MLRKKLQDSSNKIQETNAKKQVSRTKYQVLDWKNRRKKQPDKNNHSHNQLCVILRCLLTFRRFILTFIITKFLVYLTKSLVITNLNVRMTIKNVSLIFNLSFFICICTIQTTFLQAQQLKENIPPNISQAYKWWNLLHYTIEITPDYNSKIYKWD